MPSIHFTENANRFSAFTLFQSESDETPAVKEATTEATPGAEDTSIPQLSYLRLELKRIRPGMSDFIIRVSTPKYDGWESNKVVSIRGNRSLVKYDSVRAAAKVIGEQMLAKKDATYTWDKLDVDSLADMLAGYFKYFAVNTNVELMQITTEAL